jgi:hypothetical protein
MTLKKVFNCPERHLFRVLLFPIFLLWLFSALAGTSFAGPPFLTDDPEPIEFRHFEAYVFSTVEAMRKQTDVMGPAFEFNVGALPNVQVHIIVPLVYASLADASHAYGLGDIEFGVKYRFIQETDHWPMVGIYPMIEIPTGDASRGLGNGQAWWRLPLWLQKSWGAWTTYGGAGYVINPAPRQQNYCFGGWLLERGLSERLTLGGEIFAQGKSSDDIPSFAVLNLGGIFKITPNFQLLFSGGRSFAGGRNTVGYLGLYWTGKLWKGTDDHSEPKTFNPLFLAK